MENHKIEKELIDRFKHYFPGNKHEIRLFFAPGRVNLIGEHTDYNNGYVLPAALNIGTYMVVRPREDRVYRLRSENFPSEPIEFDLDGHPLKPQGNWGDYPKGVMKELNALNVELKGADVLYQGYIPNGAGLSSSASIGMVTAYGFSRLMNKDINIKELALLCQRMENRFIGVNTGIMDQMAVGLGEENHAIFLNCETLHYETVPLNLGNYKIVITNTNKRRGLAESKYNERREECHKGVNYLKEVAPELTSLSDVSIDQFKQVESILEDPTIKSRVRHVVTENQRVILAKEYLRNKHLIQFGQLMMESHRSLRDDYEVTGKELDALFEAQRIAKGCIGTRMTGAGFGGCTVSLVNEADLDIFKQEVEQNYTRATGLQPIFYTTDAGNGVKEILGVTI